MCSAGERINMGMKRSPADGVGRGEFEEPGANQTPRGVVISRPNPSGIGQRGRAEAGAVRRHRPPATEVDRVLVSHRCFMAVHELVRNARMHGALSVATGWIAVKWE